MEDEKYFYFIRENYQTARQLDIKIFSNDVKDFTYQRLLECYLQIFDAIKHIHAHDFYHGNINPDNILIDEANNNRVFLLDFGKSYFYKGLYPTNAEENPRFYAPEQIEDPTDKNPASDIYAFGLCMLKMLLDGFGDKELIFEKMYSRPDDLDSIFQAL